MLRPILKTAYDRGRYSILLFLVLVFIFAWCPMATAETLEGKIIGVDGRPKQYASVSIFGAKNRRTQTNESGQFTVDLPPGSYVIRVWQQPNRQDFNCQINPGATKTQTFKVGW